MKNVNALLIGLLCSAVFFSSCEKYPDGGLKSKAEKRIVNSWNLSTYYRNGSDETSLVLIDQYVETYSSDGSYSRTYISGTGDDVSETGAYKFTGEKDVDVSGVSSIEDFSAENSTLSSSTYIIKKLTTDEYWYAFENGGDSHEFRLVLN